MERGYLYCHRPTSLYEVMSNTVEIFNALGNNNNAASACNEYSIESLGNSPCEQSGVCYEHGYLPAICE